MQIESNGIKTWISPKIKKENNISVDSIERNDNEEKLPSVGADLALASLGVLNNKSNTVINQSLVENKMMSPAMQFGEKGNVTSIFYINDIHGRLSNMERITTASLDFDNSMPSYIDTLKLSAGDIMLGSDVKVNQAANSFLNANNFMANVIGNHEVDQKVTDFVSSTKDALYKVMGANVDIDKSHKLYNRVIDSYIQEDEDKNKYGIIALMPFDLSLRSANKELFDGLKIEQMDETKNIFNLK